MFWYVNSSVAPCRDFFSYVCSNIISDESLVPDDQKLYSWRALITGDTAAGARRGDTGRFVTAYYRSCMEIATQRPSFMRSLASALVKIAWKGAGAFKSREAFAYMDHCLNRVQTSVSGLRLLRQAKGSDVRKDEPRLQGGNAGFRRTRTRTGRLHGNSQCDDGGSGAQICTRILQPPFRCWPHEKVSGLEGCGYSLRNVTSVEVQGVGGVRTFYSAFAANEGIEAAAKTIAYLVWYSVFLGSREFYRSFDGTAPSVFKVCMASLRYIPELQSAFAAAQFMSREKDVEVRKIFARVRNSVYADCQRYSLIDPEDSARFESFFKNVQIVSYADLAENLVPIPHATDSFGENLLRGRAYGFDVVKWRHLSYAGGKISRYGYVDFSGHKWLQLFSVVYKYLSADPGEQHLPNYAFVGRVLAETLWYMVFTHSNWSARTLDKIGTFRRCFVRSHPRSNLPVAPFALTIATLGLASTVQTLNVSDWYDPVVVRSMLRVSPAQFFYVLTTFHKCPTYWDARIAQNINSSMLYLDDFANAFRCPKNEAFMKIRQCVLEVQRRR
ncbi:hypothetical protein MTO96_051992 [Rhipicephalus appendiculatus]